MSHKYLGDDFDIHGGGADLIFPHHENEIAQSEAANKCEFVRYWMHNGFITVNNEKMSKSLGNFFLLRDILAKFPGEVVRFYLISTHYRSPIDFDDNKLEVAAKSLNRIRNAYLLAKETAASAQGEGSSEANDILCEAMSVAKTDFEDAMEDDFNTALAIAAIFDFCRLVNGHIKDAAKDIVDEVVELFDSFDSVIACIAPKEQADDGLTDALMDLIIEIRQNARKNKDWATADAIRDKLKDMGIVLEDGADGVRWKRSAN